MSSNTDPGKQPAPYDQSNIRNGLSHHLTEHAAGLLNMAMRLNGTHPAMPMEAEFQALEISIADLQRKLVTFKGVLIPHVA